VDSSPKPFVISLVQHGLGDEIARLPAALSFFRRGYKPYIVMRDALIPIIKALFPKGHVITLKEYEEKYKHLPAIQPPDQEYPTSLDMHLVDHGFITLCDNMASSDYDRSYPILHETDAKKNRYIAIQADYTAPNRQLAGNMIDQIAKEIGMMGYVPMYLGSTLNTPITYKIAQDLRGELSLEETFDALKTCRAIIGVDGGLLHLAALTDMPIIAAYPTVNKLNRMPYRNGILGWNVHTVEADATLKCSPCQSLRKYDWETDFRFCSNENKDYACLKQLTKDKWLTKLKEAIREQ
jgi:hypothetical protein